MDKDKFWREIAGHVTTDAPLFVTAELVDAYGPLPDWLSRSFDMIRNGYLVGVDTPEAQQKRVDALRTALEPYFD